MTWRASAPGSRYVADLTKVDRYSFVMHLVSRVVGELRRDLDVLHAYRACMNMGTLSGAPKGHAMQLIAAESVNAAAATAARWAISPPTATSTPYRHPFRPRAGRYRYRPGRSRHCARLGSPVGSG